MSRAEAVEATPAREGRRRAAHARRRQPPGMLVVGVLGELLITASVIVALFVVWQVFWTDVTGARAATDHIGVFEEALPESPVESGSPQTGEPPIEPTPAAGETFATMFVPTWGPDWEFPVAEGVGRSDVLDEGYVGHYPDTQMVGTVGNFAIAGHRQSHGKPFFGVDSLDVGDSVIVQTARAWYVYRVTESYVVLPTQTEVIAPNPADPAAEAVERTITLTTCHPLWSTRERWIVHGVLDHWIDRDDGRPAEMMDGES